MQKEVAAAEKEITGKAEAEAVTMGERAAAAAMDMAGKKRRTVTEAMDTARAPIIMEERAAGAVMDMAEKKRQIITETTDTVRWRNQQEAAARKRTDRAVTMVTERAAAADMTIMITMRKRCL